VRAFFHAGLCFGFALAPFGGPFPLGYLALWSLIGAQTLLLPLLLRYALLFPDDRMPPGRSYRVWPWLFSVLGPIWVVTSYTGRWTLGEAAYFATIVVGTAAILAVRTYKYRHADALARRQSRWFVTGTYCLLLPVIVSGALMVLDPRFRDLFHLSFWAVALTPLSLVISVWRFNLFDVDRVLSAAASYNLLAVALGAAVLVIVPRVAEAASGLLGIAPGIGQVALSLALAALVIPGHRRLRPQIDRLFFKERYAVDQGVAQLLTTLSSYRDARELTEGAGAGLQQLFRPDACVVYAAAEQSYRPVFVAGRAVPPAFARTSPLVASLAERHAPLSLSSAGRRPDRATLSPFDRAALETLGAEVVVPVHQGEALSAFLCLGPKRSGDVYTPTDLSLLAAIAEKVSAELRRFDQEETIRQGREMQEALRRYVPAAVADQLSDGGAPAAGEREVSVLFVDLRGYSGFAESRGAEEIFSTVNRYTEAVSKVVQNHGGSVVEFNGDGMMAVFGAPRELANKERAAVEAARAIVDAVGCLPVEGSGRLAVGVGIATGAAFVGNIQAADRMIWSAIGNTTNLAARLQGLTRELDAASVVIDATTWERAQSAAAGFAKQADVAIRGRRERLDVYALPIRSSIAG
jgi:class 3 adenylate cyclase